MGKGDKKTKRGKIIAGSYGRTRPKNKVSGEEAPSGKEKSKKKTPAKKKRKTAKKTAKKSE